MYVKISPKPGILLNLVMESETVSSSFSGPSHELLTSIEIGTFLLPVVVTWSGFNWNFNGCLSMISLVIWHNDLAL